MHGRGRGGAVWGDWGGGAGVRRRRGRAQEPASSIICCSLVMVSASMPTGIDDCLTKTTTELLSLRGHFGSSCSPAREDSRRTAPAPALTPRTDPCLSHVVSLRLSCACHRCSCSRVRICSSRGHTWYYGSASGSSRRVNYSICFRSQWSSGFEYRTSSGSCHFRYSARALCSAVSICLWFRNRSRTCGSSRSVDYFLWFRKQRSSAFASWWKLLPHGSGIW